jgi:hypothetical protein
VLGFPSQEYFVISFRVYDGAGGTDINAQIFDAQTITAIGPRFQINTYTTDWQYWDSPNNIAMISSNAFVIAWTSVGQDEDASGGVYAQRFFLDTNVTARPTTQPTVQPTTDPSAYPTNSPTMSCETLGFIYHHDWDNTSSTNTPFSDYSISIDITNLSVSFEIELEYAGYSTQREVYGYGTSYVIDFLAFESNDYITSAGSCSNRLSLAYENVTAFADYWLYSEAPYIDGHLASKQYLAYQSPSSRMAHACIQMMKSASNIGKSKWRMSAVR